MASLGSEFLQFPKVVEKTKIRNKMILKSNKWFHSLFWGKKIILCNIHINHTANIGNVITITFFKCDI